MNIREAILKAADHIEANPGLYAFSGQIAPGPNGGCPACMWGWIGHFLGMYGAINYRVAEAVGAGGTGELYRLCPLTVSILDAANAAHTLRAYADKYHPDTMPYVSADIPAEVLAIFGKAAA